MVTLERSKAQTSGKEQRTRSLAKLKRQSRVTIQTSDPFQWLCYNVAIISETSIASFMSSSPSQRFCHELLYEGHPSKRHVKENSSTSEPATVCDLLLTQLIAEIFGHMLADVPFDIFSDVITKLSRILQEELEGRGIPVSMSPRHIQRMVRAVHRELCQKKNNENYIIVNLPALQDKLCRTIVDALMKHLMKSRKKLSIRKFFSTVYTFMVNSLSSYETLDNDYTK